jgi:hypothetical protein
MPNSGKPELGGRGSALPLPLRINLLSSCFSCSLLTRLKRSNQPLSSNLICSHGFAVSPRISREFCVERPPTEIRGRSATPRGEQGMPGADAPAAARGVVGSTRVSHHGHTGITRHSPRNGFNSLFRALPGDRAFLPPSPPKKLARSLLLENLTPASGHQDHTTSPSAASIARQARRSVHRIPPLRP